jgi:hypothetical protein
MGIEEVKENLIQSLIDYGYTDVDESNIDDYVKRIVSDIPKIVRDELSEVDLFAVCEYLPAWVALKQ